MAGKRCLSSAYRIDWFAPRHIVIATSPKNSRPTTPRPARLRPYSTRPTTIVTIAITRPPQLATISARCGSRVICQTPARNARPPSSGSPGSTLNTATIAFVAAIWNIKPPRIVPRSVTNSSAPAANASTNDTAGPDSAITASARGVGASRSNSVKPPRSSSVMPRTPTA